MDIDVSQVTDLIGQSIVALLGLITSGISTVASILPNPDPFTEILVVGNITLDPAAVLAYQWLNTFFDVSAILGVFMLWITMYGGAWLIILLWRWAKAVR